MRPPLKERELLKSILKPLGNPGRVGTNDNLLGSQLLPHALNHPVLPNHMEGEFRLVNQDDLIFRILLDGSVQHGHDLSFAGRKRSK